MYHFGEGGGGGYDSGRGCACGGAGGCGKSPYLLLKFTVHLNGWKSFSLILRYSLWIHDFSHHHSKLHRPRSGATPTWRWQDPHVRTAGEWCLSFAFVANWWGGGAEDCGPPAWGSIHIMNTNNLGREIIAYPCPWQDPVSTRWAGWEWSHIVHENVIFKHKFLWKIWSIHQNTENTEMSTPCPPPPPRHEPIIQIQQLSRFLLHLYFLSFLFYFVVCLDQRFLRQIPDNMSICGQIALLKIRVFLASPQFYIHAQHKWQRFLGVI